MTTYTVIKDDLSGSETIVKINDDGSIWFIPTDPANSDYQAYLNPVEHLTEIPTP